MAVILGQLALLVVMGSVLRSYVRGPSLVIMLLVLAFFGAILVAAFLVHANNAGLLKLSRLARGGHAEASFRSTLQNTVPARPRPTAPPIAVVNPMERISALDWFQFEKFTAALFSENGFAVERFGGANPDGGIDLLVTFEGETRGVQCKHWKSQVGVRQVREFVGSLKDRSLSGGIFVTLTGYTSEAKALALRHDIELAGEKEIMSLFTACRGEQNATLLALFNQTEKHCPKCEGKMQLRTARQGESIGSQFWGCSQYPRCRGRLPFTALPASPPHPSPPEDDSRYMPRDARASLRSAYCFMAATPLPRD